MNSEKRIEIALHRIMADGLDGWFTPANPTDKLRQFSESIGAAPEIMKVPVEPFKGMVPGHCFDNCIHVVKSMGGELVHGWAWHQLGDLLVVAEFHGVWRAPDGQLIDLTPPAIPRAFTTFSCDPVRVQPDAKPGEIFNGSEPNRRLALKDIEDVHEFICAEDASAAMHKRRFETGQKTAPSGICGVDGTNCQCESKNCGALRKANPHGKK